MKKVKITVLKSSYCENVPEGKEKDFPTCPMHKLGQTFFTDFAKPRGFCEKTWKKIYKYVYALVFEGINSIIYYNDWTKVSSSAKCHYDNNLCPIILKLELIDTGNRMTRNR